MLIIDADKRHVLSAKPSVPAHNNLIPLYCDVHCHNPSTPDERLQRAIEYTYAYRTNGKYSPQNLMTG